MDSDIAWEECVGDIPLDTKNLPPLNALSTTSSSHLPDIDLLHLFSFDSSDPPRSPPPNPPTPESASLVTTSSPSNSSLSHPSQTSLQNISHTHHHHHHHHQPILSPPPSPLQSHHLADSHDPHIHPQQDHSSNSPCSTHQNPPLTDQSQLVLELSTRLASAGAEATALRKRVAALTSENRALRSALDHANARLIAVAQAASSAHPPAPTNPSSQHPQQAPVMLGVAHMTSDMASRLSGALTVSDANPALHSAVVSMADENGRERKKRKRMTGAAATTMACVMFMWGAMVGSPGLLSSSSSTGSTDANLPAVWKGGHEGTGMGNVAVPSVRRGNNGNGAGHWQPNCMRVLEQLPDKSESELESERGMGIGKVEEEMVDVDDEEEEEVGNGKWIKREIKREARIMDVATDNEMFVDVEDKASAAAVSLADARDPRQPVYSYVLVRDSKSAMSNVKACRTRMRRGERCEEPHTISLIVPAEAAGLDADENETESVRGSAGVSGAGLGLVEVQCSITAVGRIPVGAEHEGLTEDKALADEDKALLGRVIATVPETGTVITR